MKTTRGQIKDRAQKPQEGEQRIDRRTVYGNKFVIGKPHPDTGESMTRDDVCDLFEERQLPTMDVEPLRGKRLLCWCKPEERCHADSIIEKLNCSEHGIGHNSNALKDIATRARLALEQVDAGEKQTMEGWLQYGAARNEGREMFPSDKEFGQWLCSCNLQLEGPSAANDAAAAMWAAANPKEFESIKEANPRVRTVRGLHAKWKEEQKTAEPEECEDELVADEIPSTQEQKSRKPKPFNNPDYSIGEGMGAVKGIAELYAREYQGTTRDAAAVLLEQLTKGCEEDGISMSIARDRVKWFLKLKEVMDLAEPEAVAFLEAHADLKIVN